MGAIGGRPNPYVRVRRAIVAVAAEEGMTVPEMYRKFKMPEALIRRDLSFMQVKAPSALGKRAGGNMAQEKAARSAAKRREEVKGVRDRRRFQMGIPATGETTLRAPAKSKGTLHVNQVRKWTPDIGETILKDGATNRKIGGDVLVGPLVGAKIFTLSLEERATCPKACHLWAECYGNQMHLARRWSPSRGFTKALQSEVRQLCEKHRLVLIRLHVLGDFYSFDYLRMWVKLLDELPNLNIFGFTAWGAESRIGAGIARVRDQLGVRFAIRHSVPMSSPLVPQPWHSTVIDFPTEKASALGATVCPEQRHANDKPESTLHCGSCGLCWKGDTPLAFIQH